MAYSPNLEARVQHLATALALLRKHTLFAKMSKCSFAQEKVEYLGHIITAKRVEADPKKIEAMKNWPLPMNVKQLRGFLGLTGYFRRFVKEYGEICKPLTNLLRKNQFQ